MLCGGKYRVGIELCSLLYIIHIWFLNCNTDEIKSAVVDLGSSTCRFGTAGQDVPRHTFRSVCKSCIVRARYSVDERHMQGFGDVMDGGTRRTITGDVNLRCFSRSMEMRRPVFTSGEMRCSAFTATSEPCAHTASPIQMTSSTCSSMEWKTVCDCSWRIHPCSCHIAHL
jgi:hypothetical protein